MQKKPDSRLEIYDFHGYKLNPDYNGQINKLRCKNSTKRSWSTYYTPNMNNYPLTMIHMLENQKKNQ